MSSAPASAQAPPRPPAKGAQATTPRASRRAAWRCGALVLLAAALGAARAHATLRPEPLQPGEGCERWTGRAAGNDPTVQLDVELCPGDKGVSGRVQWSSLRSGWNVRAVEGAWSADGQTLTLRDVRIVEEKPNPGYRFCTIDRYELGRVGADQLEGKYDSKACRDEATVSLRRAPSAASGATSTASAGKPPASSAPSGAPPASAPGVGPPPAGDTPAPDPTAADDGSSTGCSACVLGATRGRPRGRALQAAGSGAWLLAAALLVQRRRRRARRRQRPV